MPRFPNLFLCYGPGTNLAHSAGLFFHAEFQTMHAMDAIHRVLAAGARTIEVRQDVHDRYVEELVEQISSLVWAHPTIQHSHYKNPDGKVYTLSPWTIDALLGDDPGGRSRRLRHREPARRTGCWQTRARTATGEETDMQAARVVDGELVITQVDVPDPANDEARVRITSAGVCHSDLHLVKGHWFGMQIPEVGHEAIGVVEALGPGAERFTAVGDRVILGLGGTGGGYWCGACIHCLGGEPRLCDQGSGIMGTFAEQFCVNAKSLVTLPPSIGDEEAPLACGGLTAYGAIKKLIKHSIVPGSTVAVIGAAGGLGHYAVQLLKAFGYKVVGVDLGEEKLAFVKDLGRRSGRRTR